MRYLVLLIMCITHNVVSQTEFFASKINFSDQELATFYSALTVDSVQVYFSANDYTIYAYNKKSGARNWSHYAATKSNNPPNLYRDNIFISKHISQNHNQCVQLSAKNGDTIQQLSLTSINSKPVFKDDIMYCTAIDYEGGQILAYDLIKNEIVWKRFIAHGVDTQPYFLKDKIIANAEADNWFDLDYNGNLLNTNCKNPVDLFVPDIRCVKNFKHLTHNQKVLSEKYSDAYEEIKIKYIPNKTLILSNDKLLVFNDKNRLENEFPLIQNQNDAVYQESFYKEILQTDGTIVWFLHQNSLSKFDFKNGKKLQNYDLTKWSVHQAVLDGNNLWLISRTDGQLYGLRLE